MGRFVKKYTREKRVEYGGWPLAYGMNPYRCSALVLGVYHRAICVLHACSGIVTRASSIHPSSLFY
jgi:hypothetical protein